MNVLLRLLDSGGAVPLPSLQPCTGVRAETASLQKAVVVSKQWWAARKISAEKLKDYSPKQDFSSSFTPPTPAETATGA